MVLFQAEWVAAQGAPYLLDQGRATAAAGDKVGAVALFTRAIEADRTLADAYVERAVVRLDLDQYKEAEADLDRYLTMRPGVAFGWAARAEARVRLNNGDGALRDANRAIFLDASEPWSYFYRGYARNLKGDCESAVADYSTTLRLDPKNSWAYTNRAACRVVMADPQGAMADYGKALELRPGDDFLKTKLTALQLRMGVGAPPPLPTEDRSVPLPPPPALPVDVGAATTEPAPVRVGGEFPAPRLMKRVDPDSPPSVRAGGLSASLRVDVVIGLDGRVRNATPVESEPLLAPPALAAVRQWEFEPPLVSGRPAVVILTVTVIFK
jgi:tetratricopeptide (TPR) repeat protein